MSRMLALREAIDAPWLVERLGAFLDRKREVVSADDLLADNDVPDELARFAVGQPYGRHNEAIIRREVRRAGTPLWFDARNNPGHFGYISRGGFRVFLEVELNMESRNAPSTFEKRILSLVEANPEPMSLFDAPPSANEQIEREVDTEIDSVIPEVPLATEPAAIAVVPPTAALVDGTPIPMSVLYGALRGETTLDFATVPDASAPRLRAILRDLREDATRNIDALLRSLDLEMERRIGDGRAIPTPVGPITATPVYTEYSYNLQLLRDAQPLLPEVDAKKLVKHVPPEVIPAYDVHGDPRSIAAIRDKYSNSDAGKILARAMTRSQTGVKIVWPKLGSGAGMTIDADDGASESEPASETPAA